MRVSNDKENIRAMFVAGQSKWPALSVSFETFAEHCSRVLTEGESLPLEPADLYLCCACTAARPEALQLFETEGKTVAEAAIRRIDDRDDFVRDALQELWNKLLLGEQARVRSYSGRGPLSAWVRVAATRVALDRRRAYQRSAHRQVELTERLAATEVNLEASLLKARFGQAFQAALRASVADLSEQERNVLRMHVVGRCSIDEIGLAYGAHRATAARWIERARGKIYQDVRRELCAEHKLTASEFHSLATLIGAELELSLGFSSASVTEASGKSA